MALNAIFLGLGGISLQPIVKGFIKDAQGPKYTVTVGIGQGGSGSQLDGDTPGVSLWTATGEAIGGAVGSGKHLAQASAQDITFVGNQTLGNGKAPAEYISVSNGGKDAICIAYVAVIEPTNTKRLFLGDAAANCGADWYPSSLLVSDIRSKCFWLDKDGSNGLRFQGVGIHMPSFSNENEGSISGLAKEYDQNRDAMCNSAPRLKMYETLRAEDPIVFFDPPFTEADTTSDGADKDLSRIIGVSGTKTNLNLDLAHIACTEGGPDGGCPDIFDPVHGAPAKIRRSTYDEQLVISHFPEHSAAEVCGSKTSVGPDFISMKETKFCDMKTKTLWDVCTELVKTCCFDASIQRMRSCGVHMTLALKQTLPSKEYTQVDHWGLD